MLLDGRPFEVKRIAVGTRRVSGLATGRIKKKIWITSVKGSRHSQCAVQTPSFSDREFHITYHNHETPIGARQLIVGWISSARQMVCFISSWARRGYGCGGVIIMI
jgi:hypothetical protein